MSLRWTPEQLQEYRMRHITRPNSSILGMCKNSKGQAGTEPDNEPEHKLQRKIEAYCKEHGLYYFHDRSRGANQPGHPDLVIACKGSRVLWLELKSKRGRLTKEQQRIRLMLVYLGHEFHTVRSFRAFLGIVEGEGESEC